MRGGRMTSRLTAEVADEINACGGARVRAVHQDRPTSIRLALRAQAPAEEAAHQDLVIDLVPTFPRVFLAPARRAPRTPSALAGALRKHLVGARIARAWAVPGERALAIAFDRGDHPRTLWVELFGGQANWYLLDDDGRVLWTLRGEVAARREASRGMTFTPTPARAEDAPEPEAVADEALQGSALVRELARSPRGVQAGGSAAARLRRLLKKRHARAAKAERALHHARKALEQAPGLEREGELLRGAFHLLRPGLDTVVVPDYTQDPPEEVRIQLQRDKPAGDQIAERFRRAKRLRRTAEQAEARYADSGERLAMIQAVLDRLTDDDAELASLQALVLILPEDLHGEAELALQAPVPRAPRKGPTRALPWFEYTSSEGWTILVGRDARGNDALTLRHARPGDLFLHVRSATGSHVIVPTPRGKSVPRDTLLDAAELACHFSERRQAERCEVDYTPRRYLRKPKGSPPGLVLLERSKTLSLRRDGLRRERLLSNRRKNQP